MKTFSFQNDWRRFPHVVAFTLLLLAAGCGGNGDDNDGAALGDQSAANGLWTGTIGGSEATAVLQDGFLMGFRMFTVASGDEDIAYFVDYQVADGDVSLTGEDRARGDDLMLRATLSGTGASRTMTGTLGTHAVNLTLADNNGDTADQSLLTGTWSDVNTWTGSIGDHGVAMGTVDSAGAFTGMNQYGGCVSNGRAVAETTPPPLYLLTMTISLCTDAVFNGNYRGWMFFADGGQNDVLNSIAFKELAGGLAYALAVMERQ